MQYHVQQGIEPDNILLVTFGKKAADEVNRRLAESMPGAKRVTAKTFHSYCFRLIKQNYRPLGFTQAPTTQGQASDVRTNMKIAFRCADLSKLL